MRGIIRSFFSHRWNWLLFLALGLWPKAGGAIITTAATLTVEWHIEGIPDADIRYTGLIGSCPTYTADIRPNHSYAVSLSVVNGMAHPIPGYLPLFRSYSVDIPYVDCLWRSEKNWLWTNGIVFPPEPVTTLTHRDPFAPNADYNRIQVRYVAGDGIPNGAMYVYDACIWIFPSEALSLGYLEWFKGLPPYTGFDPPVNYRKPEGCNPCGAMGLPGFRLNTATMNLVVEDTDFEYQGLGPPVSFRRTWNADPGVTGMFGLGWSFTYESAVAPTPVAVAVSDGSGRVLGHPTPRSLFSTNATGEVPIYYVTNPVNYSAAPAAISAWDGRYLQVHGERAWLSRTQDTARGVTLYLLHEDDRRLTWQYEGSNEFFGSFPLQRVIDHNDNALTFAYATNGWLTNVIDAVGRVTRFQYNAQGRCTNMLVPTGYSAAYRYSAAGDLVETRDLAGNVTRFSYDARHYLTNMSTEGKAWSFRYETSSYTRVNAIIDPLGRTSFYTILGMNLTNRLVSTAPASGGYVTYLSSDGEDRYRRDRLDQIVTTVYSNGWPVLVSNQQGRVKRMSYDDRGRLRQRVDFDGATQAWAYNDLGLVVAATNARGQGWRYDYDARGNLTNKVSPLGRSTRMSYDATGRMTTLTEPGGRTTSFQYDSFGNLRTSTDPAGRVVRFGYDAAGLDLVALTNARGAVWRYEYDANRRLTRLVHPDGAVLRYDHDCCARTAVVDERGATNRFERSPWQYVTRHIDPLGRVTGRGYDAANNLVALTNPAGRVTRFQYDLENRLTNRINTLGDQASWVYNALGQCSSFSPTTNAYDMAGFGAYPPEFLFNYNEAGRLLSYSSFYYKRDRSGLITNLFTARGSPASVDFSYDAEGRLTQLRHNNAEQAAYSYNDAGDLVAASDAFGATVFQHDLSGLVTNISYPEGWSVGFAYDQAGLLRSVTYPGGVTLSGARNARNWITNLSWGACAIAFQYDAAGQLIREIRSSGATSEYAYAMDNAPTSLVHRRLGDVLISHAMQRNNLGLTTNLLRGGLLPVQPVFAATNLAGAYDRRLTILQHGDEYYACDFAGAVNGATGSIDLAIAYDAENRPTRVVRDGRTNEFIYGANGRCVRSNLGGVARRHFYDHFGRLLFETDEAGQLLNLYFHRDAHLVALRNAGGMTHFYHFDASGNTLALTDERARISAAYRYLPYGEMAGSFSRTENPFTFMGRDGVREVSNGLYMTPHRFYDARCGRFLQYDPIGPVGGFHPYEYAAGNPIDFSDPLGLINKARVTAGTINAIVGFPLALFGIGTANPLAAAGGSLRWVGGLQQIVTGMNEEDEGPCSIQAVAWNTAVPPDFARHWVETFFAREDPEPESEPEPYDESDVIYSEETPFGTIYVEEY